MCRELSSLCSSQQRMQSKQNIWGAFGSLQPAGPGPLAAETGCLFACLQPKTCIVRFLKHPRARPSGNGRIGRFQGAMPVPLLSLLLSCRFPIPPAAAALDWRWRELAWCSRKLGGKVCVTSRAKPSPIYTLYSHRWSESTIFISSRSSVGVGARR